MSNDARGYTQADLSRRKGLDPAAIESMSKATGGKETDSKSDGSSDSDSESSSDDDEDSEGSEIDQYNMSVSTSKILTELASKKDITD